MSNVVDALGLSAIYRVYEEEADPRGAVACHAAMLVSLLAYAYCIGMPSSRRVEPGTYDLALRLLAGDQHPDHDTIAPFRQRHLGAPAGAVRAAAAVVSAARHHPSFN